MRWGQKDRRAGNEGARDGASSVVMHVMFDVAQQSTFNSIYGHCIQDRSVISCHSAWYRGSEGSLNVTVYISLYFVFQVSGQNTCQCLADTSSVGYSAASPTARFAITDLKALTSPWAVQSDTTKGTHSLTPGQG